jgi:hypothetical protein
LNLEKETPVTLCVRDYIDFWARLKKFEEEKNLLTLSAIKGDFSVV